MIISIHNAVSYIAAALWLVLSAVVFAGLFIGNSLWGVNALAGVLFLLVALVLYRRAVHFGRLNDVTGNNRDLLSGFVRYELLLMAFVGAFALLLVAMAAYRVFGEGFPVFG